MLPIRAPALFATIPAPSVHHQNFLCFSVPRGVLLVACPALTSRTRMASSVGCWPVVSSPVDPSSSWKRRGRDQCAAAVPTLAQGCGCQAHPGRERRLDHLVALPLLELAIAAIPASRPSQRGGGGALSAGMPMAVRLDDRVVVRKPLSSKSTTLCRLYDLILTEENLPTSALNALRDLHGSARSRSCLTDIRRRTGLLSEQGSSPHCYCRTASCPALPCP